MSDNLMTSDEIGRVLGISGRHVRRYAEEGMLPTIKPGRHDVTWMANLRAGEAVARKLSLDKVDCNTLVALGRDKDQSREDVTLFIAMFERNGKTRDAALMALGYAKGLKK